MFELTRATTVGALVDEIHLSEYGLVAFVNGRRFHGLLTLLPMVLWAVLGAAVARRSDRGASPHSGWGRLGAVLRGGTAGLTAVLPVGLAVAVAVPARGLHRLGRRRAPGGAPSGRRPAVGVLDGHR